MIRRDDALELQQKIATSLRTVEQNGAGRILADDLRRALELADALVEETRHARVIELVYTTEDVKAIAAGEDLDPDDPDFVTVDEETAIERALEWGKHIQDTAAQLCSEQLTACVRTNQP